MTSSIPLGICQCGCGRTTTPAQRSGRYPKGMLQRFCVGHKTHKPIVKRYRKAHDSGNQFLHRVRAEKALGRPLPFGVVVHHADGTKGDAAPLVICQDESYHRLLHKRLRVKQRGGNPNLHKVCGLCKTPKPFDQFTINRGSCDGLMVIAVNVLGRKAGRHNGV